MFRGDIVLRTPALELHNQAALRMYVYVLAKLIFLSFYNYPQVSLPLAWHPSLAIWRDLPTSSIHWEIHSDLAKIY